MRFLLLFLATFAAGLLVGAVFWPEEAATGRSARSVSMPPPDWSADDPTYEPGDDHAAPELAGGAASGRNADVRALTREAKADLERLKSSAQAQEVLAGTGEVTGTVRDPAGEPVSGVIVTALPQTQPFTVSTQRRRAREQSHKDRDLSEVAGEAIELELWRRYARRTATTDSAGRFKLEGLMDMAHTLSAFHEKYDIKPLARGGARVQPDAVLDFVARPVAEVPVEVKMPDGATADNAYVQWRTTDAGGQEPWVKTATKLRLPIGPIRVRAQKWTPEPLESEFVEVTIRGDAPNAPLVIELKGRRVLEARLVVPEGFLVPRNGVEYRMRLLAGGGEDVDPMSLLKNQSQRRPYSRDPGRAYWFDLEPGRYLVAAFLHKRRLLASAVVEVADGTAEVDLDVDESAFGPHVVVRILEPGGGPVPGDASFRVVTTVKGRQRNPRVDALQLADGSWHVLLDDQKPGDDGSAQLRIGTRYGGAVRPLNLRGGGTITIRLDKPALMKVEVAGYSGSGVEGMLHAALRSKLGADAWGQISANGTVDLRGVQPGDYKLQLWLRRRGTNWCISSRRLRLRSGDDEQRVGLPALHKLTVRWAGKGRPRDATLICRDENLDWTRRTARLQNNVATFDLLAAGSYEIRIANKRVNARAPGNEVVVQ